VVAVPAAEAVRAGPNKAESNLAKHGVSFDEATAVFADELSLTMKDPDHSAEQERFIIFGRTPQDRYLVVGFSERGARIRLITARCMTCRERETYQR